MLGVCDAKAFAMHCVFINRKISHLSTRTTFLLDKTVKRMRASFIVMACLAQRKRVLLVYCHLGLSEGEWLSLRLDAVSGRRLPSPSDDRRFAAPEDTLAVCGLTAGWVRSA